MREAIAAAFRLVAGTVLGLAAQFCPTAGGPGKHVTWFLRNPSQEPRCLSNHLDVNALKSTSRIRRLWAVNFVYGCWKA